MNPPFNNFLVVTNYNTGEFLVYVWPTCSGAARVGLKEAELAEEQRKFIEHAIMSAGVSNDAK